MSNLETPFLPTRRWPHLLYTEKIKNIQTKIPSSSIYQSAGLPISVHNDNLSFWYSRRDWLYFLSPITISWIGSQRLTFLGSLLYTILIFSHISQCLPPHWILSISFQPYINICHLKKKTNYIPLQSSFSLCPTCYCTNSEKNCMFLLLFTFHSLSGWLCLAPASSAHLTDLARVFSDLSNVTSKGEFLTFFFLIS